VLAGDALSDIDGLNSKLRAVFDGFTLAHDGSVRDWTYKGGMMGGSVALPFERFPKRIGTRLVIPTVI